MKVTISLLPIDAATGTVRALAKVEKNGRVYASTYADGEKPAAELTAEDVRRAWKNNRRAFLPYDETTAAYCA